MKIFIRHLGRALTEINLEEGRSYLLGRAPECDIRLSHEFISRRHGRLYQKNGKWFFEYEGLHDQEVSSQALTDDQALPLGRGLELATEKYVAQQKTSFINLRELELLPLDKPKKNSFSNLLMRSLATMLSLLLIGGGGFLLYQKYQKSLKPLNAIQIRELVRPKVVELELVPKQDTLEQLKKYLNFKDEDLAQSVGFCSGFIIAPKVVLTANHCVFGTIGVHVIEDFIIKTYDGKKHTATQVLGMDYKKDYLFLEVPSLEDYPSMPFASDHEIGERVYTIGNVHGEGIAIREGITASRTKSKTYPDIEFLRYSAAASPGNSGGPLVNTKGEVLGLVFARSNASENYNLATDFKQLKEGFEKFVSHQEEKTVTLALPDQGGFFFSIRTLLESFGLNDEDKVTWENDKKLSQKLQDIQITLQTPIKLKGLQTKVYEKWYQSLQEGLEEALNQIAQEEDQGDQEDQVAGLWSSQANENTPLIIPYPQYDRLEIFAGKKDFFLEEIFQVYLPASSYSYKLFKENLKNQALYQYSAPIIQAALNTNEDIKKQAEESGIVQFEDALSSLNKAKLLGSYEYYQDLYAKVDYSRKEDFESSRQISKEDQEKIALGSKGIEVSSYLLQNLIEKKPNTETKIFKELPKAQSSEIKDDIGRVWSKNSWKLLETYYMDQYCLSLPQGYTCLMHNMNNQSDFLAEKKSQAFIKNKLSQ
ncbi:MAG: trypsin-like peptidase domain-containing protein, partial [Deltaproteobacteria bacterium]|nr:trypsin-like peptidase domain-containing protein [Deltaproteobacteria bacterium]